MVTYLTRTLILACSLALAGFSGGCKVNPQPQETPARSKVNRVAADGISDETYNQQFDHIDWREIGRSVENRPIYMTSYGDGEDVTLFITCFHGNERCTPRFGFDFADLFEEDPSLIQEGKKVVIVPILNPDGFVKDTRRNANGVDLNRNYPTTNFGVQPSEGRRRQVAFGPSPASEPETKVIMSLLKEVNPAKIIAVHQPLLCNNNDGPMGLPLAKLMAQYNGYPVKEDIGFPTPGSFGTYAGKELGIPMVTLELPEGEPNSPTYDAMWENNRKALLAVVNCNYDELE